MTGIRLARRGVLSSDATTIGNAGDGATASTFPVLVDPVGAGKSKALALPGATGNYLSAPDVNLLDADTAHFEQSVGEWLLWSGSSIALNATGTPAPQYGNKTLKVTMSGSGTEATQIPGPASTQGFSVSPTTEYTFSIWVYTGTSSRESRVEMIDYDVLDVSGNSGAGAWTALTVGGWTQVSVTLTTAADAANVRMFVRYRVAGGGNPAASEEVFFDAACLRAGSDATFLPSTRIVGDLDLRAHIQPQEWAIAGSTPTLVAKWTGAGDQRSYRLQLEPDGFLRLYWSTDGTSLGEVTEKSTAGVGFSDGDAGWVRATLDVDNGASGYDVTFYTSTDGVTWTQLGTTVTGGAATSIYAGTANVEVGTINAGTANTLGPAAVYEASIHDGIGGPAVLTVDPDTHTTGDTFTTAEGHTVTVNRSGDAGAACGVTDEPCWLFTGAEYLTVDDRAALEAGTGPWWMFGRVTQFSAGATDRVLMSRRDKSAPNAGWEFNLNSTNVAVVFSDGSSTDVAGAPVTIGAPVNALGYRDGSNVASEVDGTAGTPATDNARDCTIVQDAYIGVRETTDQPLYGLIHAVACGTTLTAAERTELGAWDGGGSVPHVDGATTVIHVADRRLQVRYPVVVDTRP